MDYYYGTFIVYFVVLKSFNLQYKVKNKIVFKNSSEKDAQQFFNSMVKSEC